MPWAAQAALVAWEDREFQLAAAGQVALAAPPPAKRGIKTSAVWRVTLRLRASAESAARRPAKESLPAPAASPQRRLKPTAPTSPKLL
jgi:hypothetical protein